MCDGFSEAGEAGAVAAGASASAAAASAAAAGGAAVGTAGGLSTAAGVSALAAGGAATAGAAGAGASAGILGTGITTSQLLTGLQVVSALAGLGGAAAAKTTGDKAADAQTKNALTARAANANQVNLEVIQAHDAASQKINSNNTAAREASGAVLAGSAGVGGISVDSLLGDISGKAGKYNTSVQANLDSQNASFQNQMANVNTGANNVINQERIAPPPDYLGTSLRIGGDVAEYLKNNGH